MEDQDAPMGEEAGRSSADHECAGDPDALADLAAPRRATPRTADATGARLAEGEEVPMAAIEADATNEGVDELVQSPARAGGDGAPSQGSANGAMAGFDPEFVDFPDYIIKITKRIWEDRDVTTLRRYYSDDVLLRLTSGIYRGNVGATSKVLSTLVEYPDRQILAQDVIWCGSPENGMLSSHRSITTATHAGDGPFGRATGKRIRFRAFADCYAKDNMIRDEWIVRDNGGLARQMGFEPEDMARSMIAEEGGPEHATRPFTPAMDHVGPYTGRGNDNEWGQRYADILARIMDADLAVIRREYDRACTLELPGNVSADGHDAADRFWIKLRSAFPTASFQIHHVMGREDPLMPPRAALRWTLHGPHAGWDAFGRPSGAEVFVMGISHAEFGPWGLRREWVNYDELAIWRQILLHKG